MFHRTIHAELPEICRKLFGSPSTQSGLLTTATMLADRQALLELLNPNSAFVQYLLKSTCEPVFFDIYVDQLPESLRILVESYLDGQSKYFQSAGYGSASASAGTGLDRDLPAFIRDRLVKSSAGSLPYEDAQQFGSFGGAPAPSSTVASSQRVRLNMFEYFLFLFLQYATLPPQTSFTSYANQSTRPTTIETSSFAKSNLVGSVYVDLLSIYTDFLLPLSHALSNPTLTAATSMNAKQNIFDCSYVDRHAQVNLSVFYIEALCELWMVHQNEIPSMITTQSQVQSPINGYDMLFQLIFGVESHILKVDWTSVFETNNLRYGSMEELSMWNPLEWIQTSAFKIFKSYIYRLLKSLLISFAHMHEVISFEMLSKIMFKWLSVPSFTQSADESKFYMMENLPFYTTLFDEYLAMLSSRLPLNTILVQLSTKSNSNAPHLLPETIIRDLTTLVQLMQSIFNLATVEWLSSCEKALTQMPGDYQMADDEFLQRLHESFAQLEQNQKYTSAIGSVTGGAGKLLKRLYQYEIFLQHFDSVADEGESKENQPAGWISSVLSTHASAVPTSKNTNARPQLKLVRECLACVRMVFFHGQDELIIDQWKEEAENLLADATISSLKFGKKTQIFQQPDSSTYEGERTTFASASRKLTRRGIEQIIKGEQKCSNRDLLEPQWNPHDLKRFQSNELRYLAVSLVTLGNYLNRKHPQFLDFLNFKLKTWTNDLVSIPRAAYQVDFCWLRVMAMRQNLLFLMATMMLLRIMSWLFL